MENQSESNDSPKVGSDVFVYLIFGLHQYLKPETNRLQVPNGLRYALNELSFAMPETMPKTLYRFVRLAHTPVSDWYPLVVPETFNRAQPLLYDNNLSGESQEYHLELSERMEISPDRDGFFQSALDNLQMQIFRERLRQEANRIAAQALYENVRLFLITNSWTTLDELRSKSSRVREAIRPFYDAVESHPQKTLRICDRCGLLRWHDGYWVGVKPSYCSDHADDSPLIHDLPMPRQFLCQKEGIHLCVFIPGRIELALFEFADEMREKYPDELVSTECYPGIDAYDLSLTFRDNNIWAVDAKDQAYPYRLAQQINPPYGEGNLAFTRCFFVLPDERYAEDGYMDDLNRTLSQRNVILSDKLGISSLSAFRTQVEKKLKLLAKCKGRK